MTPFPHDEIEDALEHHRAVQRAQDWNAYADLFTADGVYVEHEMGTFRGREAIREWIVATMAPLVDAGWEYPIDWTVIDANRVIYKWWNRLRNPDGRAEPYQFAGMTVLEYAGGGLWSYQEDFYNMKECEKVMGEYFAAGGTM